VTSDAAVQ
jgi:hypothetical protein